MSKCLVTVACCSLWFLAVNRTSSASDGPVSIEQIAPQITTAFDAFRTRQVQFERRGSSRHFDKDGESISNSSAAGEIVVDGRMYSERRQEGEGLPSSGQMDEGLLKKTHWTAIDDGEASYRFEQRPEGEDSCIYRSRNDNVRALVRTGLSDSILDGMIRGETKPIPDLLKDPQMQRSVEPAELEGGGSGYLLHLTSASKDLKIWVDPEHGFFPARVEKQDTLKNQYVSLSWTYSYTVREWMRIGNVWAPKAYDFTHDTYDEAGRPEDKLTFTVTFSDIRLTLDGLSNAFKPHFPDGTYVQDDDVGNAADELKWNEASGSVQAAYDDSVIQSIENVVTAAQQGLNTEPALTAAPRTAIPDATASSARTVTYILIGAVFIALSLVGLAISYATRRLATRNG